MAACRDGFRHHYKVIWQKTHKAMKAPGPWSPKKEVVEARWHLELCDRCGIYRGLRPGNKYYALTKVNAQSAILDHYENYMDEVTVQALTDL